MKSDLITKNKLLEYIDLYPEAKTNILLWIKEFGRRPGEDIKSGAFEELSFVSSQLGASDYRVQFTINPWLKTAYVTWFGTEAELIAKHEKEIKELRAENPDLVVEEVVVSYREILTPPPPLMEEIFPESEDLPDIEDSRETVTDNKDLFTKAEYEGALKRVIEIFDARPGTSDFAEIELLLPGIKKYEESKIVLPDIDLADLIKVRMKEFQLTPESCAHFFGGEEDMNLFLACRKQLSLGVLRKLFRHLGIVHVDASEFLM